MKLSENIYNHRMAMNLSQGDLANALEVSRQSVSKWENSAAVPELDKLIKMSDLFQITLDELVYGPKEQSVAQPTQQPARPAFAYTSARMIAGTAMLMFGMVFFLLSIFWGDHLNFGEEIGELISICIVLLSIALIGCRSGKAWAVCAVIYFVYSLVCFGILHVSSIPNYLFIFASGIVIMVWFIYWGMKATEDSKSTA